MNIRNKNIWLTLNEQTENAPVMSVYIVPVMVLASAAKQNTSCVVQVLFWRNM